MNIRTYANRKLNQTMKLMYQSDCQTHQSLSRISTLKTLSPPLSVSHHATEFHVEEPVDNLVFTLQPEEGHNAAVLVSDTGRRWSKKEGMERDYEVGKSNGKG